MGFIQYMPGRLKDSRLKNINQKKKKILVKSNISYQIVIVCNDYKKHDHLHLEIFQFVHFMVHILFHKSNGV